MTGKRFARFEAVLSSGGSVRWLAEVVRVEDGIAFVRHPARARAFPFSPVRAPGLYKYDVRKLQITEGAES